MKKILFLLTLSLVLFSCEKDEDGGSEGGSSSSISVSPSTLRLGKSAGSDYVYVTSSQKWSVAHFTSHCDCSPHTGNAGRTKVRVTVKKTSTSYTSTIRFSSGGGSAVLTVKQS